MHLFSLFILCFFIASCGSSSADTSDVKKTINAFVDIYEEKNTKIINDIFSEEPQAVVYSMGPEMWKGPATIKKQIDKLIDDVQDSNIEVRDQVIKSDGNVAWFSMRGDWSYDFKGQRTKLEGVRMTGVLLNQGGKWKIVQWHTSYPVRTQQQ
jgi:ketosteroid isomerase-like protein